MLIQINAFEYVVWKMAATLSSVLLHPHWQSYAVWYVHSITSSCGTLVPPTTVYPYLIEL